MRKLLSLNKQEEAHRTHRQLGGQVLLPLRKLPQMTELSQPHKSLLQHSPMIPLQQVRQQKTPATPSPVLFRVA
ncbi:hypothetical protein PilKf_01426 [Pillotina sp. SPG140]